MEKDSDWIFLNDHLPVLGALSAPDRDLIRRTLSKSPYAPGEIILSRNRECNGLVIVKKGQLRAFFESESGKEITLYRLLCGDVCILTASCVLKNITFEVTLETEKESEVLFIPAAVWAALADRDRNVKEFSMELVNKRFSEVMWVMEQMVSRNMGQRLAAFLLEQAKLEHSETLVLTHEAIAKNLGTAREVISRLLKYLENDGFLRLSRGKITLTNPAGLRGLCGGSDCFTTTV